MGLKYHRCITLYRIRKKGVRDSPRKDHQFSLSIISVDCDLQTALTHFRTCFRPARVGPTFLPIPTTTED